MSRLTGWIGGSLGGESAELAGRDISRIGCYMASGYSRLAVVLEGIYAHEGLAVPTLAARAHQVLDADD